LTVCGRPLFDPLTTSTTFLDRFVSSFRNTCARLRSSQPRDNLPLSQLFTTGTFLFRVMTAHTSQPIALWTKGHELEIYKILSDAVTIYRDPKLSPVNGYNHENRMSMAINFFHAFAFHLSKDIERRPYLHSYLAPGPTKTSQLPNEPLAYLYSVVRGRNDRCYVAGCKHSFQEVGIVFRNEPAASMLHIAVNSARLLIGRIMSSRTKSSASSCRSSSKPGPICTLKRTKWTDLFKNSIMT
jgi:hypothetical protein